MAVEHLGDGQVGVSVAVAHQNTDRSGLGTHLAEDRSARADADVGNDLTTSPGEVINFIARQPYAHLQGKPLWPPPENPDSQTLVNPIGARGLIGNLGLTAADEPNLVAFLQTLSDVPPASASRSALRSE